MTCQRCANEASIHLTETVDGRHRELHLCPRCARAAGVVLPKAPPALALHAVVENLIKSHVGELVGELAELTCPECGLRYMEYRATGQLGCPADYQVFAPGLLPLLGQTHAATRHVGKVPHRPVVAADRARLRLRSEFRAAIVHEDYERAASLRDQLRLKDSDR